MKMEFIGEFIGQFCGAFAAALVLYGMFHTVIADYEVANGIVRGLLDSGKAESDISLQRDRWLNF